MTPDPHLPGAELLLDDDAALALAPAVEGAGGRLLEAAVSQVRYDPGRRLVVRYRADVVWADGTRRTETLGALADAAGLPDGLAVVERDDGARLGVWRYPYDPFLPGLPQAAYPGGALRILRRLGVDAREVEVSPLVYRPGSRAVLRVRTDRALLYVKVVRPATVDRLRRLHEAFLPAVRVPQVVGWSSPLGLVAFEPLLGTPLTQPLTTGGAAPPAAAVASLLDRVRAVQLDPRDRPPRRGRVADQARLLATALPEEAGRLEALAGRAADLGTPAERTVHGDFYEAQLLVDGTAIVGVVDVDDARVGSRYDDPATLLGHLVGLAHVRPGAAERLTAYRRELDTALGLDGAALRAAVLGVLLGLATTPFRRQEPAWAAHTRDWLDLCDAWAAGRR